MLALHGLGGPRATYEVVLGRGARRRFETELRALVGLPWTAGLLPVAGGGLDVDGHPYVQRALDGLPSLESLGERVRQDGRPLDVDVAVTAVVAVLDGVAALHRAGLVHGGIRPDVILTGAPTGPLLADPVPRELLARTGPLGPAFAAPEVLQGDEPTPAADVYAVAATLVHLVNGRGPWTDGDADAAQVLLAMVKGMPPDLGVLAAHPGVAAAAIRALAADPAARPDATGLAGALSRGLDAGTGRMVSGADRLDTVSPYVPDVPVAAVGDDATEPGVVPTGRPLGSGYRLHEELGRGATGTVFRGTGHASPVPTEVAVKVLHESLTADPTVVARFVSERTTLVELDHPHLVRVRDLVVEGPTVAIVMDLVDGPDLRRWMRTAPPLPPAAACHLLAQLADALSAVHAAGVVHRDVKPENVLLSRVGTAELNARLTDFGVARSLGDAAARLTQHGQVVGTPAYLAPEAGTGEAAGPAADVYALGVLAYELLVGCRPFTGDNAAALTHAHAHLAPGRPPHLDDRLWKVLAGCLAKDPGARPVAATLTTWLVDCARTLGDAPPLPRMDSPPPAPPIAVIPPTATTPSDLGTSQRPEEPSGTGEPERGAPGAYNPDDHLVTDVGTAPPPRKPPEDDRSDVRGRRRLYVGISVAAAVALVAGIAVGLLTGDGQPHRGEGRLPLVAQPVWLPTDGDRPNPETINLTFQRLPDDMVPDDAERVEYRAIRDPLDGGVPVEQVPEGASSVHVADPSNDVTHCYLVQAIVYRRASTTTSTTSTEAPPYPPVCPDEAPASSPPPG